MRYIEINKHKTTRLIPLSRVIEIKISLDEKDERYCEVEIILEFENRFVQQTLNNIIWNCEYEMADSFWDWVESPEVEANYFTIEL